MAALLSAVMYTYSQVEFCLNLELLCLLIDRYIYFVASEPKDPICHSNECQIGGDDLSVNTVIHVIQYLNMSQSGWRVLDPLLLWRLSA